MSPAEVDTAIDALSERYGAYLANAQLCAFHRWYGRSPDAGLVYLELAVAALPATAQPISDEAAAIGAAVCSDCAGPCSDRAERCPSCSAKHHRRQARLRWAA